MADSYQSLKEKIEYFISAGKLTIVNDGGKCYMPAPREYDPQRPQVKRQIMKPVCLQDRGKSSKL